MAGYFSWFSNEHIAVHEMAVADVSADLFPEELACLARAVPRRVHEFASGRVSARLAMAVLGCPPSAIPAGPDRAPCWPGGITGSITHTNDHCASAVARVADGYCAIGLDLEPAAPLPADLLGIICLPEEMAWLERQPGREQGVLARAIFSAKECAYKGQYPLSGERLDFHDLRLALDIEQGRFMASFVRNCPPFAANTDIQGFIRIERGHIACAMALRGPTRAGRA